MSTKFAQPDPKPAQDSATDDGNFLTRTVAPLDIVVEAIYTVLIVMTFTMAVKILDDSAHAGIPLDAALLSRLVVATLGCAVAWGLIDGVMYVFVSLAERAETTRLYRMIQNATSPEAGVRLAAEDLEDSIAIPLDDESRTSIEHLIVRNVAGKTPPAVRLRRADVLGAVYIFLIAVVIALPVIMPLHLIPDNAFVALRISNLVALIMLFILGYKWARYTGGVPWTTGSLLAAAGLVMVMIAIPLGG